MNKRLLALLLCGLAAVPSLAQEDYFRTAVRTDCVPSALAYSKSLRTSQLSTERRRLWDTWCRAVAAEEGRRLPAPDALSRRQSHTLLLPDSLDRANAMPYYWGTKGDVEGDSAVATMLCLHGSGEREAEWAANYSWSMVYDDAPACYIIPQTPLGGPCRWYFRSRQWAWRWMWLQLTALHGADARRMYVFGISEGGYGSQRMAAFYADYLAGAGPMAGGEPLENCPPENLRHTAFSLLSGENDYMYCRNKLVEIAARQLDSLQRLCPDDYVHRVALEPGRGHGIDYRPTTPWLRKHVRRTRPRHVTWEDFAMDGVRRRGFYNIRVAERPKGCDRLRWDMDIEGDTVRLDIRRVAYEPVQVDSIFGMTIENRKTYRPAVGGAFTLYLDEELVDLRRPVTVLVNGRPVWRGRLRPDRRRMMESLATWLDPERIYACGIDLRF